VNPKFGSEIFVHICDIVVFVLRYSCTHITLQFHSLIHTLAPRPLQLPEVLQLAVVATDHWKYLPTGRTLPTPVQMTQVVGQLQMWQMTKELGDRSRGSLMVEMWGYRIVASHLI